MYPMVACLEIVGSIVIEESGALHCSCSLNIVPKRGSICTVQVAQICQYFSTYVLIYSVIFGFVATSMPQLLLTIKHVADQWIKDGAGT